MTTSDVLANPEAATLVEIGEALRDDDLGYDDEQALYAELRRRDAAARAYLAGAGEGGEE